MSTANRLRDAVIIYFSRVSVYRQNNENARFCLACGNIPRKEGHTEDCAALRIMRELGGTLDGSGYLERETYDRGIHVSELIDDVRRNEQANEDAEKAHPCPPTEYIGIDYGSEPSRSVATIVGMSEDRRVVHIVTGTPSAVVAEWKRLAAEDRKPS